MKNLSLLKIERRNCIRFVIFLYFSGVFIMLDAEQIRAIA